MHCVGGLPKDPTLLSKSLKKLNYNYILSDISKKANEDFLRFNLNRINKIIKKDINKNIKIMIFNLIKVIQKILIQEIQSDLELEII